MNQRQSALMGSMLRLPISVAAVITICILAAAFVLIPPAHAQQDRQLVQTTAPATSNAKRIALVIGNGAYTNAPPLKNPPNDARDMAATLKLLGFSVSSAIDADQRTMKRLIRDFGQQLKGGGQGLFYYAGHGVQMRGRNYLIPANAEIASETDVEDQCVDLNLVLGLMDEAQNGLNIVILDACRNNPFTRSFRSAGGGLAQVDAPTGTLIAYATSPGRVASDGQGRNGLYTAELLSEMRVTGIGVEEMFKRVRAGVQKQTNGQQVPWESSSLVGNFYFVTSPSPQPVATEILIPARLFTRSKNVEIGKLKQWGTDYIHNSAPYTLGTPNEVEYEIRADRAGEYLLSVELAAEQSRPVNILVNQTLVFQNALDVTTGNWFQSDAKWTTVGTVYLNQGTNSVVIRRDDAFPHIVRLKFSPDQWALSNPAETRIDPIAIELSYWDTIKNSQNAEDFKAYLENYPKGQFATLAKNRIASLQPMGKPVESSSPSTSGGPAELAFWDAIKNSTSAEDYRAYLEKYPNGEFAVLAKRRLAPLEAAEKVGGKTEELAPSLDPKAKSFPGYFRIISPDYGSRTGKLVVSSSGIQVVLNKGNDGVGDLDDKTVAGNPKLYDLHCANFASARGDGKFIREISQNPITTFRAASPAEATEALTEIKRVCQMTQTSSLKSLEGTTWKGESPGGDKHYQVQFLSQGQVIWNLKWNNYGESKGFWRQEGNTITLTLDGYIRPVIITLDGETMNGSWSGGQYKFTLKKVQ